MPWEHAAVGYIGYSLLVHGVYRDQPTTPETLVVVGAALLPDLIDKPLAWQFDVFTTGHALAHSVFFAVPAVAAVLWLAWVRGRERLGIAFAVAYLLHLPGDVFPTYLVSGEMPLERMVWPIGAGGAGYESNFRGEFLRNMSGYYRWLLEEVTSGSPEPYLLVLFGIGGFGAGLWIYDGMPVGREVLGVGRRAVRRFRRTDRDS